MKRLRLTKHVGHLGDVFLALVTEKRRGLLGFGVWL